MKTVLLFLAICVFGLAAWSNNTGYREINVTNGATLQGTVTWKSKMPILEQIPVSKEQSRCGKSKTTPCFKLGKNNGVANTVVFLEGITQGKKMISTKPVLDQLSCEYVPHVLLAPAGKEIEITNSDPFLHNVHFYEPEKKTLFNLAFPFKGIKINKAIAQKGSFLSLCDAGHPWMSAHIVVIDHPYYALTNEDGKYVLDQIPPGKYKIRVWHEGIPTVKDTNAPFLAAQPIERTKEVTVSANGKVVVDFEIGQN